MAPATPEDDPSRDGTAPARSGGRVVVALDAMGGDLGESAVVAGLQRALRDHPDMHVLLHGDQARLEPLLRRCKREFGERVRLCHAADVVRMDDKPSQVVRSAQGTSMWSAIESVRTGEASVCVSCGNTGALMALSMLRLRRAPGVTRPAIAAFWPSLSPQGYNVMLDVGADLRADAADLARFAVMGMSYARNALDVARPRVGLLNVGTEETKGRAELRAAAETLSAIAPGNGFEFVGFVEGSDIPSGRVDVIVTDGFTGNVALKTGEGTAKLIGMFLSDAFRHSIWSRLGALFALTSLKRLKMRIDPRRMNGGVFLGLNGTVVKSHGSADRLGVAAALGLAYRLGRSDISARVAKRVAAVARYEEGGGTAQDVARTGTESEA
ncbi:MAG: phosphate acyltransferase PlsX [Rhodobacteraceae bacterium]|nr:phosphate acyltransferase PlsX [Paracoccaceae bacterium]